MEYTEGAIVKIKIENVLTYDSVEFKCGPRLNVIIGPNGSGKSTIVCAICLGLAGKTSWLGRAQSPVDYIKYGKKKARIDLELYNSDGDNYIISREINRQAPQTRWWVNGRSAILKSVEELVARLNIQVGNLTQFLPQEKVADFAKMSESELLENTEKAVGGSELFERHQKLKDSRTDAISLEQEFNNLQALLNQEQQKNARIEQDVKNFEERQKFLAQIETLEKKKCWVKYERKRQQYIARREEKENAEKELKRVKAMYAPMEKKLDESKNASDKLDSLMKNKAGELKESAKRAEANGKDIDLLADKFVEVQDEFKGRREQEETRKKRLKDLNKQLTLLEKELEDTQDTEDVQPQIDTANRSMRDVTLQLGHITQEGDKYRTELDHCRRNINGIQQELQVLRNIESQRLQSLRAINKDTYDAVLWLRENKHKFKGTVYEPPILCVNMKDPKMAKYLECHVAFNDMRAFVCESSEDMNRFMDIMKDEQKLRVNAVKAPPNLTLEHCQPKFPIQRYRKYGFHSYLQDLFTCPDAVMKFLCAQYRVQNIPVGDNRTKDCVKQITEEFPELNCFYTSSNQYNIKKSRYDGTTSSRSTVLKNASLLKVSMDEDRERELVQQLQRENETAKQTETKNNNLQQRSHDLNQKLNQLRDEMRRLKARKDIKKKLQSQIVTKKQSIHNVEKDALDLEAEEEKMKKKYKDIIDKKFRYLQQYCENTEKCVKASTDKVRLSLRHAECVREYNRLESEIREQSQIKQQAELQFIRVKELLQECKTEAKRLLDIAKKSTGTQSYEELDQRLVEEFAGLPSTVEEIDDKIHEYQVRADSTVQTDERVVDEYKKRKKEIAKLENQLERKQSEKVNHQATIEEAKQLWLEPIQQLITRINKGFSYFFSRLKCVGEVDLHVPENPENYNKYGIRIKVKFRDSEQLRELNPFHQSGGERSVTTVLYMLALQELATCPFRCVDEINQGMDPTNERKVFELVVNTVCQKSTSQYFLLTPKLLPDLAYDRNMQIICINNGPLMLSHKEWNIRKIIKNRAQLED